MESILFRIKLSLDYLIYWLRSKSGRGYGIHSPLVYSFARNVICAEAGINELKAIDRVRKDYSVVCGGEVSSNGRKDLVILARTSSVSPRIGRLLYNICRWKGAKSIIELGTCLGISASYLAASGSHASVLTLEGDAKRAYWARQTVDFLGFKNISIQEGEFGVTLHQAINQMPYPDVVYIDGNHKEKATIEYFQRLVGCMHHNSVIIIDDIRWSQGMERAWRTIVLDPRVIVSIDLFRLGVLMFPKGMPKQHFSIRF